MKLNYKEGMFLGKQELERNSQLELLLSRSLFLGLSRVQSGNVSNGGILNPSKANWYVFETSSGSGIIRIMASSEEYRDNRNEVGRAVVGYAYDGTPVGLPVSGDWSWTGKEAQVQIDTSQIVNSRAFLVLEPATTHYENALISIGSDGVGTLTVNSQVISLFREAIGGRASVIKTENNQILKVASITGPNTIQFEGTSFTAETNVRFMFLQTLSPFTTDEPEPLYTYPSCNPVVVYDYDSYVISGDGEHHIYLTIADIEFDSQGNIVSITRESGPGHTNDWLDTLGYGQVIRESIADGAVVGSKIASLAISKEKLGHELFDAKYIPYQDNLTQIILTPGSSYDLHYSQNYTVPNLYLPRPDAIGGYQNIWGLPIFLSVSFYDFNRPLSSLPMTLGSNVSLTGNSFDPSPSGEGAIGTLFAVLFWTGKSGSSFTPVFNCKMLILYKDW